MKPTAIIFDMDGVLIDSEPAHRMAKEQAFAQIVIAITTSFPRAAFLAAGAIHVVDNFAELRQLLDSEPATPTEARNPA
jgi:beta-phosphoglucomutase-like phosphatase (HAD superfamily)